jgi:Bacteriophage head to tail connecting protein
VEREIDILARAGMLAPPPDVMRETGGKGYKVEYESPFTRMMRNDATSALLRTVEAMTPLAQIDPSVMDRINPDETLKGLADSNGVPAKWIRTDEELKALKDGRAQQQQAQDLVASLPAITGGIKNVADAQAMQRKAPF